MGFYSFTCAATRIPILNSKSGNNPDHYFVVLLTREGEVVYGVYNGYGCVYSDALGLVSVNQGMVETGGVKLVLEKFYNPKKKYSAYHRSHDDPGQGHFHATADIVKWHAQGGFKSYREYKQAYEASAEGAAARAEAATRDADQ